MCLHLNYLCDGVVDCSVHRDDEQHCDNFQCPIDCQCIGFTVTCTSVTLLSLQYILNHKNRKAIILTSNRPIANSRNIYFRNFPWLQVLNLTDIQLAPNLHPQAFTHMPQLRILEITNIKVSIDKGNTFGYMDSLKHLYLIHAEIGALYSKTFHLPALMGLHLQHSGIHYIENCAFCFISNLETLNLSFNKVKQLSNKTFQSLNKLHILDISNNMLSTIEESSLETIAVIWFSGHITKCCYLSLTSSCRVNHKEISNVEIQNECQPILLQRIWMKIMYAFMGFTSTTLSIIFIINMLLNKRKKNNKTRRFIVAIAIIDTLNGAYLLIVFTCDMVNKALAYRIAQRIFLQNLLYYVATFPRISTIATSLEHFLMTVGMYMAICHMFQESEAYLKIARLILWVVGVSFCAIDIVLLRHVVPTHSVIWQPHHMTDFSTTDMLSIVLAVCFELTTSVLNIFLCMLIYRSVKRNETRIAVKRIPKHYLVRKRLIHLTIGRVLITYLSISLVVLLRFDLGLSVLVKQVLIAIGVPSSTIINFVMFFM